MRTWMSSKERMSDAFVFHDAAHLLDGDDLATRWQDRDAVLHQILCAARFRLCSRRRVQGATEELGQDLSRRLSLLGGEFLRREEHIVVNIERSSHDA